MKEILYVKVEQNVSIDKKTIKLKDVATFHCVNKDIVKHLDEEIFYTLPDHCPKKMTFTILKVYEIIHKTYPDLEIQNEGERDFIVEYQEGKGPNMAAQYAKTCFVAIAAFIGAAFTIITFNEDVSVADVFDKVYQLIMGHEPSGATAMEVCYAIGIPVGVLVFFNHFRRKEIANDPTPIQVEMRTYEEEMNKAVLKTASREGKTIDVD